MPTAGNALKRATKADNPYPGLLHFTQENSHFFFGRDGQTDSLLARLKRSRFLAVVGTSGSGKSSLVRARLLPSLCSGYLQGAGSDWLIADFRPGSDPFSRLSAELASLQIFGSEAEISSRLREDSLSLVEMTRSADLSGHNLLILVDQFEELFRFRSLHDKGRSARDERAAFVKIILEAATANNLPIYVVITMRSDFLGDCAEFRQLPEAISDGQYLIPRLTREQQRMAIEGPARVAGGAVTNRLVQKLLNDTARDQDQDQLPLLQHALMRTWDAWCDDAASEAMDLKHYEFIGSTSGALSQHAEQALAEARAASPSGEELVKTVFQSLSGRDAEGRETRRECSVEELVAVTGASSTNLENCLKGFRLPNRAFIMPLSNQSLTPAIVIDVTHECLLRKWQRLRDEWLPEEIDSASTYRKLVDNAQDGVVLSGRALSNIVDWWRKRRPNQAWAARYPGSFEKAKQLKKKSQVRRSARFIGGTTLLALLLVYVGVMTTAYAGAREETAAKDAVAKFERQKRDCADTLVMARTATSLLSDPSRTAAGALLAAAAYDRTSCDAAEEARDALVKALSIMPPADRRIETETKALRVAFATHGARIAIAEQSGRVSLWDTQTLALLGKFENGSAAEQLEISGDGSYLAVGSGDTARAYQLLPGHDPQSPQLELPCAAESWVSLSEAGDVMIATCGLNPTSRLFKREKSTWREEAKSRRQGMGWLLSRDGQQLSAMRYASQSEFEYLVWAGGRDPQRRRGINAAQEWEAARSDLRKFAWSTGANVINVAAARDAGEAVAPALSLKAEGSIQSFAIADDGSQLAAVSNGGVIQLWALPDATETLRRLYEGTVNMLAIDNDGGQIAVALDREVRLIQLGVAQQAALRSPRLFGGSAVGVTKATNRLVAVPLRREFEHAISLPVTPCPYSKDVVVDDALSSVAYVQCSPPGPRFEATVNVAKVNGEGGDEPPLTALRLDGVSDTLLLRGLAVSDKAQRLAVLSPAAPAKDQQPATAIQRLRFVDVASRTTKTADTPGNTLFWMLAPSGTAVWAVVEGPSPVQRFDFESGKWAVVSIPASKGVTAFAVSPDEGHVALATREEATGSADGAQKPPASVTKIWDLKLGKSVTLSCVGLGGAMGTTSAIAFARDGGHVITADGSTVRVWDLEGKQLARVVLGSAVSQVAFSSDGHRAITVAGDQVNAFVWDGALVAGVCERAGRDLSPEEWAQYVPNDVAFKPVCTALETATEGR